MQSMWNYLTQITDKQNTYTRLLFPGASLPQDDLCHLIFTGLCPGE